MELLRWDVLLFGLYVELVPWVAIYISLSVFKAHRLNGCRQASGRG
jgi:hypothetical protein